MMLERKVSGYLVDDPFDSVVDVIEPIDLICLRFLTCMSLLRAVRLCPQKSVAALQDACRSVFFPECTNDGTTCNSGRSVGKVC